MLKATKALNQHTKRANDYDICEKEKNKRVVLAIQEIKTDQTFAFLYDHNQTDQIKDMLETLNGKAPIHELDASQKNDFLERKNKVHFYHPKKDDIPSSIVINLISKDSNATSGVCFYQNLNKVEFTNYGEYANYMTIKNCHVEYFKDGKYRCLEGDETPINLPFDSNRQAFIYISEVTMDFQDTLCDITKLNTNKGVRAIRADRDFFYYKKIIIEVKIVSIYNNSYECDFVLEVVGNGMIAYIDPEKKESQKMNV